MLNIAVTFPSLKHKMEASLLFFFLSLFFYLLSFFFSSFLGHQERLKKVKSELGKAQLGNITVDMVMFYVNSCLVEVNYCSFLVQVLNIAVSFKYF